MSRSFCYFPEWRSHRARKARIGLLFFVSFEVKQNCLLFERVDKCPVLLGISSLKLNYSLLRDYGNAFQHCEVKHEIKNYAILKELIALPTIFVTYDIYRVYNFSSPMGLHVHEKIHHWFITRIINILTTGALHRSSSLMLTNFIPW